MCRGCRGRGSGRLGERAAEVGRAGRKAARQPLRGWCPLRDSGHAVDTGGAVCVTVVGIARIR